MRKRSDNRRSWQEIDGYKLGVAAVLALVALFFLLVTIMPIVLFKTLEDASWEFKTLATSYRPAVALVGLVLFMATGWSFLRVVRGPQILPKTRRRTTRPAQPLGTSAETGVLSAETTAAEREQLEPAEGSEIAASAPGEPAILPLDAETTPPPEAGDTSSVATPATEKGKSRAARRKS